jgi:6-pyruvoyltetrahydropterin/6-carboxytetrahydropterin synthase
MYTIKVKANFSSAHNLRGYKGKCEDLHGHNWHVEVVAGANELDSIGMVMDFKVLKKHLKDIMFMLDHKYLNDLECFKEVNPTSENIAKYIFDQMTEKDGGGTIREVTVWETEGSCATYCDI